MSWFSRILKAFAPRTATPDMDYKPPKVTTIDDVTQKPPEPWPKPDLSDQVKTKPFRPTPRVGKGLTEADYVRAAEELSCEVAAIKAVAKVESGGRSGFLKDGRPKILFEAHVFGRQTKHRFGKSHPNLSRRKWTRSLYVGGAGEHDRLAQAKALDETAALKSASWGVFQIMGFNHKAVGCTSVQEMVERMHQDEGEHLMMFAAFIKNNRKMWKALQNKNWATFARLYNGSGYRKNRYDTKMAIAYKSYL